MLHRFWRLSERTDTNFGVACTGDGLFLGRTPLIERRGSQFVARDHSEIERLLGRAYGKGFPASSLMPRLAVVAAALNANDLCLACIAAVHLRIPDLPSHTARDDMETEDSLIKSTGEDLTPYRRRLLKASPDDQEHPGWPAGTPDGLGGKFRPKDDLETAIAQQLQNEIERIAMRRAFRMAALALLRLSGEGLANLIPFVGLIADAAMIVDIARTMAEYRQLVLDSAAAVDFVKKGPYSLQQLQVQSNGYEEFSSYREFYKDGLASDEISKRFGGAGDGSQYHHIVTQGGANAKNFSAQLLQNTDNVIRLPTILHEAVSGEYSKAKGETGMTVYEWLQTQPYDVQREEGLKILRSLHILK
jgi:hypothetical protein